MGDVEEISSIGLVWACSVMDCTLLLKSETDAERGPQFGKIRGLQKFSERELSRT
jgi:hypothetical protein